MKYKRNPKQCETCKEMYLPTGNCSRFCVVCSDNNKKQYMKDFRARTYIKKGRNQFRENNNNWKGGIGVYREIKAATECEECSSKDNLLIHHRDENRRNNDISNLQCLCKRCHQVHHKCWEVLPKGDDLSKLKKGQVTYRERGEDGKFIKSPLKV